MDMKSNLDYTFDDEPVKRFFYDSVNKKIEVFFDGCYSVETNQYVSAECKLVIDNWCEVNGQEHKLNGVVFHKDLNHCLAIFDAILSLKKSKDTITLFVETIDNRYITLEFKDADMYVMFIHDDIIYPGTVSLSYTSFSDVYVKTFLFSDEKRIIKLSLNDRPDNHGDTACECIFVIQKWQEAKSRIYNGTAKYNYRWKEHFGIISKILTYRQEGDNCIIVAEMLDGTCVELLFCKAELFIF